ncbi:DNA-directed DNA polymerase alpha catalytic subunit pol1, partial [Borealophlyctis nickersoniae]
MSNRKEALRRLRELRERGSTALSDYKVEDDIVVYDELTEEEHAALVRRRLLEDDFVIDDDGGGYVDVGQDEWAERSDDSEEESEDGLEDEGGRGKRKRGKEKKKKTKAGEKISNLLSRQGQKQGGKKVDPATAAASAASDADLMNSIFEDVERVIDEVPKKKVKLENGRPTPAQPLYPEDQMGAYAQHTRSEGWNPERSSSSRNEPAETPAEIVALELDISDDIANEPVLEPTDENPMSDVSSTSAPLEKSPEPVSQVQVKALRTKPATKTSAASFAPKFERREAKTATVVTAPDTANWQGWMSLKDSINVQSSESGTIGGVGLGNKVTNNDILEADKSLRMFWFDAYEKSGLVYVFGKVLNKKLNKYVSCCVTVKDIQRNLFVLPRARMLDDSGNETDQPVEMGDVYNEFNTLRQKFKISTFQSVPTSRKYAFEVPGVPAESDYLKVVYPFSQPPIPGDQSGKSFSHIFGTNTSALELFILKRKLMGPCWIRIEDAKISDKNISWCKVEITVDNPKSIRVFAENDETAPKQSPPLVVMALTLRTVMNHQKHQNEIVAASGLVYHEVNIDGGMNDQVATRFTALRQLDDVPLPAGFNDMLHRHKTRVEVFKNERAVLGWLTAHLHRNDPDIIVGHNFIDFDLDVLLHRMKANTVEHWSRIGRLRRTQWPKLQSGAGGINDSTYAERQIASGRLLCDTYRAAQDSVRAKSYSLTSLTQEILGIDRPNIDYDKISTYFWNANQLMEMIQHCEFDGYLSAKLMHELQVLPLTKQLTNLAGNLWSRTMTGARAERNEYLLLHEFHDKKFVVPDKSFNNSRRVTANQLHEDDENEEQGTKRTSSRRKPAYAGGLVLEPKKGFYDKYILLLDFNSLYPSIIQEYNICFTTVQRNYEGGQEDQLPDTPYPDEAKGILPKLLATLVERRRNVKNLMKSPKTTAAEMAQYDIRQKGLKLTANSMYGCLGFSHSRFYAKPLAMLITAKGREILQNTVDLAQQEGLDVIYGDTDSIMINTNTEDLAEVRKIGANFKKAVNKRYKLLEIEMDGFFQRMLLLKKKKYAALAIEEKDGRWQPKLETKGLDLIFSNDGREEMLEKIHKYLTTVGEEVRQNLIPIDKYVINKNLTKNPDEYADKKSQPHVQVAMRMKSQGKAAKIGDTIPYVICQGDGGGLIATRAYHPEEVLKDGSGLKIDFEWYLSNQVHPPIARLCAPIEGTDTARIAECLGLDAAKYYNSVNAASSMEAEELVYTFESQIKDEERFRHVLKWMPRCRWCKESAEFEPVSRIKDGQVVASTICPNPSCGKEMPLPSLHAQLNDAIRFHVRRYANGWLVCEDAACRARTRHMGVYGRRCLKTGCRGAVSYEFTDRMLYRQMEYFERLFDATKKAEDCKDPLLVPVIKREGERLGSLRDLVQR